ncbi:MAG: DAK2 domain-containing protein, partial [Clostridia bacterium]|nr:DAK2 domain-containing protein [Clostridia bacterium]
MQKTLNSTEFRKMVASGARMLEINRADIDAKNVFPVPDGDTGTNMSLTLQSAVKEMNACSSNRFQEICDAVSKGALRGARGNSGVITSQIFRGICSVIKDCNQNFDTKTFAKALEAGTKVAYSAVSIPKEGTILTVIRLMSESASKLASKNKDFVDFFKALIAVGDEALAQTPELLPVLKKAGVVDSGGYGLMVIMRGFLAAISGEDIGTDSIPTEAQVNEKEPDFDDNSDIINLDLGDIEFAYCTEFFVINLKQQTTLADIDKLKERLMSIGDSVICIGDLEFIKVHVHTNTPGVALTYALELGEL